MKKPFFWVLILLVGGCGTSGGNKTSSTEEMISYLTIKADSARQSVNYPYFTDVMLRRAEESLKGIPLGMGGGKVLNYSLISILKGDNQRCIDQLDYYLLKTNNLKEINLKNSSFYKVLALAHLREAEQQNCISNHSASSCIVPLSGDGVHSDKAPAEQAKGYYLKLLEFDSTDYQSRWFYNLAHMATGTYPNEVEIAFLLAPDLFASDIDFPKFQNIAVQAGVCTNNHAGGSSLEDFDNDGLLDIFTTSYSLGDPAFLYLNQGTAGFVDFTQKAGIEGLVGGLNNIHADFNNDGWTDIYVMRGAWLANSGQIPNSLLVNKGGGRFSDETKASGVLSYKPTGAVSTADVNLDGYLDIFVGNEGAKNHNASELFLNKGDGTFTNVAKEWGMEQFTFVKGANWGDINNDGRPDLFISNYGGANKLFVNRGGETKVEFEEIADMAGVEEPVYSFTTWFWDYNQDGWQDILVFGYDNRKAHLISNEITKEILGLPTTMEHPRLYLNNQNETFTDVTEEVGLNQLLFTMGGNFGDLNNDGYPDFYAGTGEFNIWATVPNKMFLNNKGTNFLDVTTAGGFGQIQKGHGVSFGDFDNDGDQDIYHQVGGAVESDVFHNMLFLNPGFDNNWISLDLAGIKANRSAIGAKIEVILEEESNERSVYHWVNTGGSFGANSLRAEVGLGSASKIKEVVVTWPDREGTVQRLKGFSLNKHYRIIQGEQAEELHRLPILSGQEGGVYYNGPLDAAVNCRPK